MSIEVPLYIDPSKANLSTKPPPTTLNTRPNACIGHKADTLKNKAKKSWTKEANKSVAWRKCFSAIQSINSPRFTQVTFVLQGKEWSVGHCLQWPGRETYAAFCGSEATSTTCETKNREKRAIEGEFFRLFVLEKQNSWHLERLQKKTPPSKFLKTGKATLLKSDVSQNLMQKEIRECIITQFRGIDVELPAIIVQPPTQVVVAEPIDPEILELIMFWAMCHKFQVHLLIKILSWSCNTT